MRAVPVHAAVEACLTSSGVPWRRVAEGEWGLVADAGGWPLQVGVALRDGLLTAQAEVLAPGRAEPHALLHRNRRLRLVRFAHTSAGAIWVQGELPLVAAADTAEVDRLLGLLVQAAGEAREAVAGATSSR
jgi:Putative bacterial sensory transduction regulator